MFRGHSHSVVGAAKVRHDLYVQHHAGIFMVATDCYLLMFPITMCQGVVSGRD
jgi:hypothetical protein